MIHHDWGWWIFLVVVGAYVVLMTILGDAPRREWCDDPYGGRFGSPSC